MSLLKVSSTTGVKETERSEDSGIQSSTLLYQIQTGKGVHLAESLFKVRNGHIITSILNTSRSKKA